MGHERVSWGRHPHQLLCKGFVQMHRQNRLGPLRRAYGRWHRLCSESSERWPSWWQGRACLTLFNNPASPFTFPGGKTPLRALARAISPACEAWGGLGARRGPGSLRSRCPGLWLRFHHHWYAPLHLVGQAGLNRFHGWFAVAAVWWRLYKAYVVLLFVAVTAEIPIWDWGSPVLNTEGKCPTPKRDGRASQVRLTAGTSAVGQHFIFPLHCYNQPAETQVQRAPSPSSLLACIPSVCFVLFSLSLPYFQYLIWF